MYDFGAETIMGAMDDAVVARRLAAVEPRFTLEYLRRCFDPVLLLNPEGRVVFINRAGAARFTAATGAKGGRHWTDLWPAEAASLLSHAIERGRSGDPARFRSPTPGPDGGEIWWDVSFSPILNADGDLENFLVVCRVVGAPARQADAR